MMETRERVNVEKIKQRIEEDARTRRKLLRVIADLSHDAAHESLLWALQQVEHGCATRVQLARALPPVFAFDDDVMSAPTNTEAHASTDDP